MKTQKKEKSFDRMILENFLEMLSAERSVSNNTLEAYDTDIKHLLNYLQEQVIELKTVDLHCLEGYFAHLKNFHHFSNNTISRKISAIRQFFQFLVSEAFIAVNVAIDLVMPKKVTNLPRPLEQKEIDALLDAAYAIKTAEGTRTAAMLELLYATGMRISELTTLKMQSLERDLSSNKTTHYIILKGKGSKERIVLLNEHATHALKQYLEVRSVFIKAGKKTDWLFPSAMKNGKISHFTRQRFGQILKKLAVDSNLDHKRISSHKIRHSFATHMLKNGANLRIVQELLGHSDISSTQIYTKITNEQAAKLVLEKHPLKNS